MFNPTARLQRHEAIGMAWYTALINAWNGATQPPAGVTGTALTGGMSTAQKLAAVNAWTVVGSVPAQLAADLASEVTAVLAYRDAIDACNLANDHGSRMLLEGILADEEEHVNELEAELAQVQQAGVGPYLAAQIETKG